MDDQSQLEHVDWSELEEVVDQPVKVVQLAPVRDIVFEELERILGRCTNPATRGRRNRAVKLIRESIFQMCPRNDEEVRRIIRNRYARLCQLWPQGPHTDTLLASRWDACAPENGPRAPAQNAWAGKPDTKPASSRDVALNYLRQWKEEHP